MTRVRVRSESGQVVPLTLIVTLGLLLGVCALVMDVGAWFQASRKLQSAADAAALAAAQDLPASPSSAIADAQSYARANGRPLTSAAVVLSTASPNDTVSISTTAQAPLFFARALGINSATVHAHAVAQVSGVSRVNGRQGVHTGTGEPIPLVLPASGIPPSSSFGQEVSLSWGAGYQLGSGQFGLLDFSKGQDLTAPKDIADWITNGWPGTLDIGSYPGVSGNKIMSSWVDDAMTNLAAKNPTILLPVYTGGGSSAFQIVGWAAFRLDSWTKGTGYSTMTGAFVHLDSTVTGAPGQYFGAGHVGLTG